jgi:phage terminase large subunit-like protein
MTLSNTAVPVYYGKFREQVWSGEIPVSKEIELEMNRIDELIANPNYYYDDEAIEGWIRFCEDEMTLTDGGDLELLDSFKLWGEQVLSWFYFQEKKVPYKNGKGWRIKRFKKRLTVKQFLIVARGAAKSMYAELIQAYFLIVDTSTTQQITTAPTMKQADEIMGPFKTAITRAKGPVFKFLTQGSLQNTTGSRAQRMHLAGTKKGIENFLTNSILEIRPMRIDKLQGARPKCSTVDEWLSGDIREDVIGALEQGASKYLDDYVILAISSEGTVRNGSGDTIKMELNKILRGEYYAPHVSIFHYKLDSKEEVADPEMWIKAQPNIGKTVSYEVYARDVERAQQSPAAYNDIMAKRFGIPMEGFSYYFTYDEIQIHERLGSFKGMQASLGVDLSQGDDFTAFTFLFPLADGRFGVKTRSYITALTYDKLPPAMRVRYDDFIREGTLIVMEGAVLNMMDIYDDLQTYIVDNDYVVIALGFDPYNAKEFIERWEREEGPYGVVKVIQGAKTETVPLGELKIFAEQRMLLFDEQLMAFAMGNAVTLEDSNGNRKLYKKRQDQKIDNVSAMMDAYVAFKANLTSF